MRPVLIAARLVAWFFLVGTVACSGGASVPASPVPSPTIAVAIATATPAPQSTPLPTPQGSPKNPTPTPVATLAPMPSPNATESPVVEAEPSPTVAPTAEPPPVPQTVRVDIASFQHRSVSVRVGTAVIWTNRDAALHTVTAGQPEGPRGLWDSPRLGLGQSFTVDFPRAGVFPYYCKVHPFMRATVLVA